MEPISDFRATAPDKILIGTLFTGTGILKNRLVELRDGEYTFRPFEKETHSTPHVSRAALLSNRQHDIPHSLSTLLVNEVLTALADNYATSVRADDAVLVDLENRGRTIHLKPTSSRCKVER